MQFLEQGTKVGYIDAPSGLVDHGIIDRVVLGVGAKPVIVDGVERYHIITSWSSSETVVLNRYQLLDPNTNPRTFFWGEQYAGLPESAEGNSNAS